MSLIYTLGSLAVCVCRCGNGKPTLSLHAHSQALLKSAVRASLPLRWVHGTALPLGAGVALVILHRALEESLKQERNRERERCGMFISTCIAVSLAVDK